MAKIGKKTLRILIWAFSVLFGLLCLKFFFTDQGMVVKYGPPEDFMVKYGPPTDISDGPSIAPASPSPDNKVQ